MHKFLTSEFIFYNLPFFLKKKIFRYFKKSQFKRDVFLINNIDKNGYSFKGFFETNSLFIHIPKCAGISVNKSIYGNLGGAHRNFLYYEFFFGKEFIDKCFTFTIVRNPYERFLSSFNYLKNYGMNNSDRSFAINHVTNYSDVNDFILHEFSKPSVRKNKFFKPQVDYLTNSHGRISIDFIAKIETINKDFKTIMRRINLGKKLLHKNKTKSHNLDLINNVFSEKSIYILNKFYAKDFLFLGYKKLHKI